MKAEGWANFLSGIFAPLAFLWLVLGFFQQGEELRNSAEALRLQGEELRASVEQQEQLVRVTREQLEFERDQLEAEREEGKRRAQPDLTLGGGSWMTNGTVKKNTLVDVHLLNRGAQCTDVNVYAGDTIVTRAAFLPTGKEAKFRLELSSEMQEGVYPIRVEYVDAMGLPGEKILTPELQKDVAGHAFLKL